MITINKSLPILGLLLMSILSFSQTVSTVGGLQMALDNATSGTIITIENGTYTNADLDIEATGTATNPIIIQAETPGGVIFEDNCRIKMGGAYITLTGVVFTGTYSLSDSGADSYVISFNSGSDCDNCTVTQIQIDDYNPSSTNDDLRWIRVYGQDNEISYNTFINKTSIGSMLFNQRENGIEDRMKIHHNYFAFRNQVGVADSANDIDVMRIGDSSQSLSNSSSEVYDNYFYEVNGGEPEVISNKSSNNQYYNNTFQNYLGSLSLRHGNDCKIYNNFFLNPGQDESYFNGGIRVEGERHMVYNNYIQGTNGTKQNSSSKAGSLGAINVSAGQSENNFVLNGYGQVIDAIIVNNTIVDCDQGLRVGPDSGGDNQNLAPDSIIVANNLFVNCGQYLEEERPATNSIFQGNMFEGNGSTTNGFSSETGLLSTNLENGYYSIEPSSPAVNASVGDYTAYFTDDIFFGSRNGTYDVGAQEYGATMERGPYTQSDVGVTVGFGAIVATAGPSLFALPDNLNYFNEDELTFVVSSNVEWSISTNVSWLTFDVTSGNDIATVTGIVTRNTSGQERVASITIVGDGLETTISVVQEGPSLFASPSNLNYLSSGDDSTFNIVSNVDWSISTDATWLTFDADSGSNSDAIVGLATTNTTGLERVATITISDDNDYGLETVISVTQSDGSFDPTTDVVEITVDNVTAVGTQPDSNNVEGNTIDGSTGNRWSASSTDGSAYLTFDLGCIHTLTEVSISFLNSTERSTIISIGVSTDNVNYTNVFTEVGSTLLSVEGYEDFDLNLRKAQYIRVYGFGYIENGTTGPWNSIQEVKFYGNEECETTLDTESFESFADKGVTLFPVPVTNGELIIVSPRYGVNGIEVYNIAGQEVISAEANNQNTTQIDVSDLTPGVYFIILEEIGVGKFIVK